MGKDVDDASDITVVIVQQDAQIGVTFSDQTSKSNGQQVAGYFGTGSGTAADGSALITLTLARLDGSTATAVAQLAFDDSALNLTVLEWNGQRFTPAILWAKLAKVDSMVFTGDASAATEGDSQSPMSAPVVLEEAPADAAASEAPDLDGDGIPDDEDPDIDGDGIPDDEDNCESIQNVCQRDSDEDGLGDLCDPDLDGDGLANEVDPDLDGDGIPNDEDNCSSVPNREQEDEDRDGVGDPCDADVDGDGTLNEEDPDYDIDMDGIPNLCDNCPEMTNTDQVDSDGDGIGDRCDDDTADCGEDAAILGTPCDGRDRDLCEEGVFACVDGSTVCTDTTRTSVEECNGVDDDCDGEVDEGEPAGCTTYYRDADGDGWGDMGFEKCLCSAGAPPWTDYTATQPGDCDDGNENVNPTAQEVCDGLDNDCDGQSDEGEPAGCTTYYRDADDDSWGDMGFEKCLCSAGAPPWTDCTATQPGDCDDDDADVHPGNATETDCTDGKDNDCDGAADGDDTDCSS
jgi:hypothetical protein